MTTSIPQIEPFPSAKRYMETYFYISSQYHFGTGWDSPDDDRAFQKEVSNLFSEIRWTPVSPNSSGSAMTAHHGKESLYLHPMMFSGPILPESEDEIKALISKAETFSFRYSKQFKTYLDITEEDYAAYLESRRDEMEKAILSVFKTKRRNLFITCPMEERIAGPFILHRIDSFQSRGEDTAVKKVRSLISELLEKGALCSAETKHGLGLRTNRLV